jgi:Flp pilus assembly protein TadB
VIVRRAWRGGAIFLATAGVALLVGPSAAFADGNLSVTGLRQEAGVVEFYLTGSNLSGGSLDPKAITVAASGTALEAKAELIAAEGTRVPKRAVALVLDTSGSMLNGGAISAAQTAAKQYLAALPGDIQVVIVTAGAPATTPLSKPTADRARANSVIDGLTAKGETALYDAIKKAGTLLKGDDYTQRRIVVLSDGADTSSTTTLPAATAAVAGIPVDTIAFKTEEATAAILAGISQSSGGRTYSATDGASLGSAFGDAVGSFSAQLLVHVTIPPNLAGQDTRLVVTATVGGGTIMTDVPVALVPDTRAATNLIPAKLFHLPAGLDIILIGLIFAGLLSLGVLIFSPMTNFAERRRRLAQVDNFSTVVGSRAQQPSESGDLKQAALALSAQVLKQAQAEGRLARQLDRAGMRMRPHEWLLARGVVSVIFMFPFALISQQILDQPLNAVLGTGIGTFVALMIGIPAGLLFGWGTTGFYHRSRASKRLRQFEVLLPDALQLVVGSLRSGFSLAQAIDAMIKEFPDPISGEFGRALGETRLGVDIEDALDRVAARMNSKDLAWAVVAVRIQRDIGGNLAEVLSTTIATIREREQIRRQVQSLSAEGRMSAYILLALPVVVVAFLSLFRREYIGLLYTTAVGAVISIIALILMGIGAFWISRVIKVEV